MRVGDVSRARRFANPARLRWYAFHRSVRFALRMMKAEDSAPTSETIQLQLIDLPLEIHQSQEPSPSPEARLESSKGVQTFEDSGRATLPTRFG
jgi:hypothetical protein